MSKDKIVGVVFIAIVMVLLTVVGRGLLSGGNDEKEKVGSLKDNMYVMPEDVGNELVVDNLAIGKHENLEDSASGQALRLKTFDKFLLKEGYTEIIVKNAGAREVYVAIIGTNDKVLYRSVEMIGPEQTMIIPYNANAVEASTGYNKKEIYIEIQANIGTPIALRKKVELVVSEVE